MKKIKTGVLGATGMVGQRFLTLLENHPWFEVTVIAASPRSAGKTYSEGVKGRWKVSEKIPSRFSPLILKSVTDDIEEIAQEVDLVFCALDLDKDTIQEVENTYAQLGVAVVSNNSAHRWTPDVPMIIPEVNPEHIELIHEQRAQRKWKKGLIAVKPNCSIQSYVVISNALKSFIPSKLIVSSLQAISGAGKTFQQWPEMIDNLIPYIAGEEEKSEKEPMKIWGTIKKNSVSLAKKPIIQATCVRVPAQDGHMACVSISFEKKVSKDQILSAVRSYKNPIQQLGLPSAPEKCITYFEEDDRPQTRLDRGNQNGMGITMGRLRNDSILDWKFVALSHNTIRGAAGGAILTAELLYKKGFISSS